MKCEFGIAKLFLIYFIFWVPACTCKTEKQNIIHKALHDLSSNGETPLKFMELEMKKSIGYMTETKGNFSFGVFLIQKDDLMIWIIFCE